jgi:hypothetical protein
MFKLIVFHRAAQRPTLASHSLLKEINVFAQKCKNYNFFKQMFLKDSTIGQIDNYNRKVGMSVSAFYACLPTFRCYPDE